MATASRPGATGVNRATRRASTKTTKSASATAKPKTKSDSKATVTPEELEPEEPKSAAHLTLEELDAEVATIPDLEPFTFDTVGEGNEEDIITIGSPGDIPYAIAANGTMDAVFAHAMDDESWEKFVDAGLTSAQAGIVFMKWRRHYGMGTQGE